MCFQLACVGRMIRSWFLSLLSERSPSVVDVFGRDNPSTNIVQPGPRHFEKGGVKGCPNFFTPRKQLLIAKIVFARKQIPGIENTQTNHQLWDRGFCRRSCVEACVSCFDRAYYVRVSYGLTQQHRHVRIRFPFSLGGTKLEAVELRGG